MSSELRLLLRRLALLLGAYQLLRLGFFLTNQGAFAGVPTSGVLLAFWHGGRFDLSGLLWLNLPLVLASLLVPVGSRRGQQVLRALFLLINLPGLAVNILDWEYFKFIGRRTSSELSTIGGDVRAQAGQLLLHYWPLLLACLALLALLAWVWPMPARATAPPPPRGPWGRVLLRRSLETLLLAGLLLLGLRGGAQLKPLRPGAAFEQQPAVLGHLALNSTFTLLKSVDAEVVEPLRYFRSGAALRAALRAPGLPARPQPAPPPNVVILLLESFASEYTGVENGGQGGYTPFFDSLAVAPGARLCPDNYANGQRSIEALPAVLAGLPSLLEEPFITSNFQTNELHGLGELLGRRGYTTAMYHGGTNGTMGFDMFAGLAGMQRYYGLNEYPQGAASPDFDGHWGIFDAPYLQYFSRQLTATPAPFFATLFTLSAHDPFTVPTPYRGRLPKGTLPIHPTIAYSDAALRRFFQTAARQPWYANTLFVLTADHASLSDRAGYENPLGKQKTPLLFFWPGHPLPSVSPGRISQQADVPASVLDLLGMGAGLPRLPFGSSVFDTARTDRALFRANNTYYLVHRDYVATLSPTNQVALYPYQRHELPPRPLAQPNPAKLQQYGDELRACTQFYVNGLIENKLYGRF